jgi:hypothetical protein
MDVFDSFEGLPPSGSTYYRAGEFAASFDEVVRNVTEFGHPDVVTFHPGFFSESVPGWTRRPAACLWMDVDLEQSHSRPSRPSTREPHSSLMRPGRSTSRKAG